MTSTRSIKLDKINMICIKKYGIKFKNNNLKKIIRKYFINKLKTSR